MNPRLYASVLRIGWATVAAMAVLFLPLRLLEMWSA